MGLGPTRIWTALPEARVLRAHQHSALLADTGQRDGPDIGPAYTKWLKRILFPFLPSPRDISAMVMVMGYFDC